jgi:hypothetical protein
VAFAAQEECDDEVDDGSGDDHDADGGDPTDNDVDDNDLMNGTDEIGVDGNNCSDDMSRNIGTVEGESSDNDVDGKDSSDDDFSTSDPDGDGDDADGSVDDGRDIFITTDCDDEVDENSDDGYKRRLEVWSSQHPHANSAYILHLENRIDDARREAYLETEDIKERERDEQLEQEILDRDARIASNVPSKADRGFLADIRRGNREQYARALRERSARREIDALVQDSDPRVNAQRVAYRATLKENHRVYVEASDSFIREQEELHARAKKECSARAANGEDARDVRARWEAFERYGCCGALDDAFFDPRNG